MNHKVWVDSSYHTNMMNASFSNKFTPVWHAQIFQTSRPFEVALQQTQYEPWQSWPWRRVQCRVPMSWMLNRCFNPIITEYLFEFLSGYWIFDLNYDAALSKSSKTMGHQNGVIPFLDPFIKKKTSTLISNLHMASLGDHVTTVSCKFQDASALLRIFAPIDRVMELLAQEMQLDVADEAPKPGRFTEEVDVYRSMDKKKGVGSGTPDIGFNCWKSCTQINFKMLIP